MTRTALITGATSGIGRAAAHVFSDAGWTVWVTGRDLHRAEHVASDTGGRALQLDVTDPASVAKAAATVTELDVLVNNAGVSPDYDLALPDADIDVFRRTYETNVFGVLAITNALLPALRRSPSPRIINVTSGTASLTWSSGPNPQFDHEQAGRSGRLVAYRSSKTALNALTLFYAQALAADGIRVDALAPGLRATNLNPAATAHGGDPDVPAAAILDLAQSDDGGPTGQLHSYDGTTVPW